jgi:hypothetical protein
VATAVAAAVLAGVWVAGGVISDDFRTSMALTAAWLLAGGATALRLGLRARPLRAGLWGGYALAAGAVAAWLGSTTLRDRVVDERVVTGIAPATAGVVPAGPVELAHGTFRSHEHATRGRAAVVRLPDGRRYLTLTSFSTAAGPDLRVRLVPGRGHDGGADGALDLGALKGNRGDQQYRLPRRARARGVTVVVWCRAFSAPFGSAALD